MARASKIAKHFCDTEILNLQREVGINIKVKKQVANTTTKFNPNNIQALHHDGLNLVAVLATCFHNPNLPL